MTLGEKLAAARQAKGLTQTQAAGDVITRNMLSLLEHDQAEPSLSTLRHLARTLEVPLSWLLDGGGEALETARTAFLAGDWKRCLDVLAAETAPLTEEGQLLRLRAALRAAQGALERGDPEAGAPLLDRAEGWLPATAYATPWEAAELARLRLRLALEHGLTPEDQRAWEASAAPAEAARQLLLARCALAQGKLREASQALRRSDGAPEAERALLQGLLEAAWGHPREAVAHLTRAEAGDLTLPDRRRCLEALEQSALALEDYQLAYTCAAKARSLGSTADGPSTMPRRRRPTERSDPMEDMIIRPAQTGDADTLARIQTASWRDGFRGILDPAVLAAHTDLSRVTAMYRRVLQNPAIRVNMGLVAETPHCLAAWSVNRDGLAEDIAELICIHSLSRRWRQGYGSAMMAHVLAEMGAAGFREAVLWVFEENHRARAFYEALGFSAEAALRNNLSAREIRYRKRLS